jgi:hypothetical protein
MSNIHSSQTVDSTDSVSISSSKSNTEKRKHKNREKLINTPFAISNISILFLNLHGSVVLDRPDSDATVDSDETVGYTYQCKKSKNPFDILFRIILSAPGETCIVKNAISFPTIDFNSPSLTPKILGENINSNNPGNNTEDLYPIVMDRFINLGFQSRYHKVINYKNSHFCLKEFASDLPRETLYPNNQYPMGIFFLRGGVKANFLFDELFLNWMTKNIDQKKYEIGVVQKKRFLKRFYNADLFQYLHEQLNFTSLFVIDFTCESLNEFPDKFYDHVPLDDYINLPLIAEIETLRQSYAEKLKSETNERVKKRYISDDDDLKTILRHLKRPTLPSTLNESVLKEFGITEETDISLQLRQLLNAVNHNISLFMENKNTNGVLYHTNCEKRKKLYLLLDIYTKRPEDLIRAKKLNSEKLKLQQKHFRTASESLRLKNIKKTLKQMTRSYYDKTKIQMPELRNLKKFQANAKQNKDRWHVVKENDRRTR